MQLEWVDRFKQLLSIPPEKPIPHDMSAFFRFWLLFDAPSLNHNRPVEIWASTLFEKKPLPKKSSKSFCQSRFTCYELLDFDHHIAVYRMLTGGEEMMVKHPTEYATGIFDFWTVCPNRQSLRTVWPLYILFCMR